MSTGAFRGRFRRSAALALVGACLLPISPAAARQPADVGARVQPLVEAEAALATEHPTCSVPISSTPVGPTGKSATSPVLSVGSLATVYDPTDDAKAAAPAAFAFDTGTATAPTRTAYATFGQTDDVADAIIVAGRVISTDAGGTFPASSYQRFQETQAPGGFAVRLRSGTLFSIDFRPLSSTDTTATVATFRSTNNGATWTRGTTTLNARPGKIWNIFPYGLRTNEQPIELADGTILVSYYTKYAGDQGDNAEVMQSTDGGQSFTFRGVIAAATSTHGFNEAGIAQLNNGSLIAVSRTALINPQPGQQAFMHQMTSTNNGLTWTTPTPVQWSLNGAATTSMPGVSPQLVLMPNGILVLSSGRDNTGNGNNWVAMSTNGLGTGWVGALTFRNCPRYENSNGSKYHGTSGNTGLAWVNSRTAMQLVDNCHIGYCLFAGDSGFTTDTQYRIHRRFVEVLTPDTGRIDLAGKLKAGRISVTGNMTYTAAAHPRTAVAGAFDGSTEYWSSAVRAGGAGSMTITLDKTYRMTRVGLALRTGLPESARVSFSTNGTTWGTPLVTATNSVDHALRYTALATPVDARYIKVDVDATTNCDAGLGTSCSFLNELELYSTTNSFENDALLSRPRGWTGVNTCWVSTSNVDDSSQAVLCPDNSTTAATTASYKTAATTSKTIDFKIKPITVPNALLFGLTGKSASGADVNAYHLGMFPNGSIQRWNGTAWSVISPAGTLAVGSWSNVSITSTTSVATIKVNGTVVAGSVPPTTAAASLTGVTLASGGTAPTGDSFAVDDVLVQ